MNSRKSRLGGLGVILTVLIYMLGAMMIHIPAGAPGAGSRPIPGKL